MSVYVSEGRRAVADALDELDECDYLTYDQRTAADEPYPPSVVAERLETLRRRRWWLRTGLVTVDVGIIGAVIGAILGWIVPPSFLVGVLPGLLAMTGIGVQRLVAVEKVVQLYVVLQRIDRADASAPAEPA